MTDFPKAGHSQTLADDLRGRSFVQAGKQGPNVRVPGKDSLTTVQEQPWHPQGSFLLTTERPVKPVSPSIADVLATVQEPPWHPGPYLPTTERPVTAAQPSIAHTIATNQEPPWHPGVFLAPNLAPPAISRAVFPPPLVFQEHRPALADGISLTRPGVQGPNVGPPVTNCALSALEQPWHPSPSVGQMPEAPVHPVPPSIADSAVTRQEQPDHPGPQAAAGKRGPDVASTVTVWWRTVQEQPGHPGPHVWRAQVYAPSLILAPESRRALTVQEQPSHPAASWAAGVQGPDVATVNIGNFTIQDYPWHPAPFTWTAQLFTAPLTFSPETRRLLTAQEQPWHPDAQARAGKQGPNVRPAVRDAVLTAQEQPPTFAPTAVAGGSFVRPVPATRSQFTTTQEQPWHPGSVTGLQFFVPPSFLAPERRQWTTAQQQPDHPAPFLLTTERPVLPVAPSIADNLLTTQEQPGHPSPYLLTTQRPVMSVPPSIADSAIVTQEQPGHPGAFVRHAIARDAPGVQALLTKVEEVTGHPQPFLRSSIVVGLVQVPPVRSSALTTQEPPGHPAPLFGQPLPPVGPHAPVRRQWSTLQELPFHPGSVVLDGKSFTGRHSPELRSFVTRLEQPRENQSFAMSGVAPSVTIFPIIAHKRLLGSAVSPSLAGLFGQPSLIGEVDQ